MNKLYNIYVYILVVSIVFERYVFYNVRITLSIPNIIIIVGIILYFLKYTTYHINVLSNFSSITRFILGLTAILLVLRIISCIVNQTGVELLSLIGIFLMFNLILLSVDNIDKMNKILVLYISLAVLISMINILVSHNMLPFYLPESLRGGLGDPRVLMGRTLDFYGSAVFFNSRGDYGVFVIPAFVYLIMYTLTYRNRMRSKSLLFILLSFVVGYGVYVTQSRSTWLALICAFLLTVYLALNKNIILTKKNFIVGIVSLGIVFLAADTLHNIYYEVKMMSEVSVYNRFHNFINALSLGVENPLIGIGNSDAYFLSRPPYKILHNTFLKILVNNGIFAMTSYMCLIYLLFVRLSRILLNSRKFIFRYYSSFYIIILVVTIIETMFYDGFLSKSLWLLYGLCLSYINIYMKKEAVISE